MLSFSTFILSGATTVSTGTLSVIGMDNFNVTMHGLTNGANVATGTLNLDARIHPSAPYVTIYSNAFAGNSGVAVQFNGPWENLRAVVSPATAGAFTVVARYSAAKD